MKKTTSLFAVAAFATMAIAGETEIFGGLGISVWTGKSGVKIAGVVPNSPADGVGLQSGDLIISANGTDLAAVNLEDQVSYLRGEAGTSISLVINRNGSTFSVSAKRIGLSVQGLDANEIANWYGKNKGLTAEEISYLANQRTVEGYELLGVMQYGIPLARSAENLSAEAVQQISVQKAEDAKEAEQPEVQPVKIPELNLSNKPLVNVKGVRVKKQGNVPLYRIVR